MQDFEFSIYSTTWNDDMGYEGKWIQLELIMLREVSQDQKHKKMHVFSHTWKIGPKINMYTKQT
jgi:hypothetical protein